MREDTATGYSPEMDVGRGICGIERPAIRDRTEERGSWLGIRPESRHIPKPCTKYPKINIGSSILVSMGTQQDF